MEAIGDGRADPAGAADRITRFLLDTYNGDRGVQVETILSAVGALAGFAAQQAIWEGVVRPGKLNALQAFTRVETESGETYFFGDLLNTILSTTKTGELSIWRFVAGAAEKMGAETLPLLEPIFAQCSEVVGTAAYGIPPQAYKSALLEMPRDALRHWPRVKTILVTGKIEPFHWPLEIGVAAQNLILQTNSVVASDIGALIVMQAAISMSKIDPRKVPGGTIVE